MMGWFTPGPRRAPLTGEQRADRDRKAEAARRARAKVNDRRRAARKGRN